MADDGQESVREAVAVFDDAESMENAVDEILSAGFDRAEVSLLSSEAAVEQKLGHAYERVEEAEDDPAMPRTIFIPRTTIAEAQGAVTGGLFFIGAVATIGGIVASGGTLAGALIAGAMGGGAGALVGSAIAKVIGHHHADYLQEQLDRGGILLWVHLRDRAHETRALEILRKHSAHDLHVHDLPAMPVPHVAAAAM